MKKILFANDRSDMQKPINKALTKDGYCVTCVSDMDAIWEHLKTVRPDLVLIDLYINGFDGYRLLYKIKEKYQRLPVLVCGLQNLSALTTLRKVMHYVNI